MTLKEIEAFYWTAVLSSFSQASVRLHITQSSLSKRVAELETSVGEPLFERSSKKVRLTNRGQRLLPIARQFLELSEQMQAPSTLAPRLSGECRFGVSELVALTWLPGLVSTVRQQHPDLTLQPYVDLARGLARRVARGELDFAVLPGPMESRAMVSEKIAAVEVLWVGAPSRLRPDTLLSAADLQRYPLITMTEGSGLTRSFERWAAAQGIRPKRTVACNSLMGIVALTLADIGISVVPARFIQPWLDKGVLVAAHSMPPLPTPDYCFIHREDDTRAVVRELKSYIHQAGGSLAWTLPPPFI